MQAGSQQALCWCDSLLFYSDRNIFAGLILAPRNICKLTVPSAITVSITNGTTNKSHCKPMRNAKLSSHVFTPYPANGSAITLAMSTSFRNCQDNSDIIL